MIKSLRGRLILTYILSFFIIISLMGGILYTQQRTTLKSIIEENSMAQSNLYAQRVSTLLSTHKDLLYSIAESDAGRAMTLDYIFIRLKELIDNDNLIVDNAGVIYPNGDLYEMNGLTINVSEHRYFQDLFTHEMASIISDPIINSLTEEEIIVIGVPIRVNSNIVGAIVLPIDLLEISASISDIQLTDNSYGWIIHPSGLILAHPNSDYILALNVSDSDNFGFIGLSKIMKEMNTHFSGVQSYYDSTLKMDKMLSYSTISGTPGWRLGITTPITEIYEPLHKQLTTLLMFLFFATILSVLLAISFASTITKPLGILNQAVEDLSQGHLSTIPENNSIREISTLVKTFNRISLELSDLSENFEEKVGQRTKSLKEMNHYLNDLATKDHLTALYNRSYTTEMLNQLKSTADTHPDYHFGILFIDLNNFKYYNDTFGHDKGDDLLKLCATIIKNRFRDTDIVTRYGGDEFIVILMDITHACFDAVLEAFKFYAKEEVDFDNKLSSIIDISNIPKDQQLNFAIGDCFYSSDNVGSIDRLIQIADERMYAHKVYTKSFK